MDSFAEIWQVVQEELKNSVTEVAYKVWLSPLEFQGFKDGKIYLSITEFKRKIIIDKFSYLIDSTLEAVFGFPVEVEYVVPDEQVKNENSKAESSSVNDYNYTFKNFIIGPSNKFAHAAAHNVACSPGMVYNPLFIYGHSGLGNTHLLLAIQNEIKERRPDAKIIYTSGEHFTNELVYYIGNHNTHAFHDKYRSCDVLLVDDIQFMGGKDQMQVQFVNTFNHLRDSQKQIVITSDRPPRDIASLDDRIKNRFESGVLAQIDMPEFETRARIIERKAETLEFDLHEELRYYLANQLHSDIRQLEGVVKKLQAYITIQNKIQTNSAKQNTNRQTQCVCRNQCISYIKKSI